MPKVRRLERERSFGHHVAASLHEHSRVAQAMTWLRDREANARFLKEADKKRRIQQFLAEFAGQIAWPFDRRVDVDDFKRFIGELAREVRDDGARFLMIAMPRKLEAEESFPILRMYTRATLQVALEEEHQVLFAHARFRAREIAGEGHPWFIHDWWHPSPAGHELLATWLADMILDPSLFVGRDLVASPLKEK